MICSRRPDLSLLPCAAISRNGQQRATLMLPHANIGMMSGRCQENMPGRLGMSPSRWHIHVGGGWETSSKGPWAGVMIDIYFDYITNLQIPFSSLPPFPSCSWRRCRRSYNRWWAASGPLATDDAGSRLLTRAVGY